MTAKIYSNNEKQERYVKAMVYLFHCWPTKGT